MVFLAKTQSQEKPNKIISLRVWRLPEKSTSPSRKGEEISASSQLRT